MPKAKQKRIPIAASPPPPPVPQPAPRTMDLIGMTDDRRMVLWRAGAQVRPISAFRSDGPWIVAAHYVIEWAGHALAVHCRSRSDGSIAVEFMACAEGKFAMPRAQVESMLLGEVVPSDASEGGTHALVDCLVKWARHFYDAPHLQRGWLS